MTPIDLIIVSIATWRLAFFISRENAPFRLMARLRERFPLGGGTACIYCMSIWAAVVMFVLWQTDFRPVVYVFAVSGLALMAGNWTGVNQA